MPGQPLRGIQGRLEERVKIDYDRIFNVFWRLEEVTQATTPGSIPLYN